MKYFSIDRIVDSVAVLIDDNGETQCISLEQLPSEVKAGDILLFDGSEYVFDFSKTEEKRKEVKTLIDQLFR